MSSLRGPIDAANFSKRPGASSGQIALVDARPDRLPFGTKWPHPVLNRRGLQQRRQQSCRVATFTATEHARYTKMIEEGNIKRQ